jgi:outer membrane beta-barrel protein
MISRLSLVAALVSLVGASGFAFPGVARAADDDDPLGGLDEPTTTTKEDNDSLKNDRATPELDTPEESKKKHLIRTLQPKGFVKVGRYELAAPQLGYVTNDPFINRYLLGAGLTYHVTEIFGVEFAGIFSPDFGKGDWKPITHQIIEKNQVTPDISKIEWLGNVNFQYSPIYGKVAVFGQKIIAFDIFGVFGAGIVNTRDDLEALQKTKDEDAIATEKQIHPTVNYGGGLRVALSKSFAVRLEARGMSYVEVVESNNLEMKNNMMLLVGASFFFPGMD